MSNRTMTRRRPKKAGGQGWVVVSALLLAGYALGVLGHGALFGALNAFGVIASLALAAGLWFGGRREGAAELATCLSGLAAVLMLSRLAAGVGVDLFALVVLTLAALAATRSSRAVAWSLGAALSVELTSALMGTADPHTLRPALVEGLGEVSLIPLLVRTALMVAAVALCWKAVGRHTQRGRKRVEVELSEAREQMLQEAREFRLIHAGRGQDAVDRRQAEELIVRGAVDAVHHTIFVTLELVKTALKAHTVVLLWFDVRNERLRIKELVSESDALVDGAIDPAGGVLGGLTRQRETLALKALRPGFRGLAYYRHPQDVTEFLGVPVIEKGHLRGVLCVDRCAERAFEDEEIRVVEDAASYVMRAVENERVVATIERARFEVSRFFEASRKLNGVLTPDQVYEVALESVAQIVAFDFAAITLFDEEEDRHHVARVSGEGMTSQGGWDQVSFASNQGLVSMVVSNRHYLPFGGHLRDPDAVVFGPGQSARDLRSLIVLPLIVQDQAVGTLVIGHREANQFASERREMLEVIANQVAVTLQNARLYERMEEMASIDALTRLPNRRTFQTRLSEAMARHKRSRRTFAVVLTDIDHFKSVNDTYGHPVGDEVLRHVGRVFREGLREVDMPARYGGEEFVLVLEDTDIEGARQVADRLRVAISKLSFETDKGLLQCTISMGIAMGPADTDHEHALVDLADQALYHSKKNGRNQVTVYSEMIAKTAAA
ncbi:diguanylate cyclase [Lujinxingia sediminis]|nr:diguanylate cyclase [Lujinxingia sediminis]